MSPINSLPKIVGTLEYIIKTLIPNNYFHRIRVHQSHKLDKFKAPGLDGFGATFFQDCWHVVQNDVCRTVRSFSGREVLKQINHTLIALIPKVDNPSVIARGVQNRLTGVSINRKSVNWFFGSKKFRTVTEPQISVNRKFRFVQNPNRNRTENFS